MADDVRLTDLEVIQRYSLAVRGEKADRAELVEALRADLTWLEGRRTAAAQRSAARPAARAATRSSLPARSSPASKPARAATTAQPAKATKAAKAARKPGRAR